MKKLLPNPIITGAIVMLSTQTLPADTGRSWPASSTQLRFDAPATAFTQSLPLGNGSQGAMVFGGVQHERIVLNEDAVWSGSVDPDQNREDAHKNLPEIQRLLIEGKAKEAQALVMKTFTCAGKGSGHGRGANVPFGCYQVLGNLHLDFGSGSGAPVITCPSHKVHAHSGQGPEKAVDGKSLTKWCLIHEGREVVWQVDLGAAQKIRNYHFTSADDMPDRDPRDWILEGSADGGTWVPLDARSDEPVFEGRNRERNFNLKKPASYRFWRFRFTAVHNNTTHFQLAEICLGDRQPKTDHADYERTLDLARALGAVEYRLDGVRYSRETFVSGADGIMVYHLTADQGGKIAFRMGMDRPERAHSRVDEDGSLLLQGHTPDGRGGDSVHFVARVQIRHQGGTLQTRGNQLILEGADSATLLLASETSFYGADPLAVTRRELTAAAKMSLSELRARHVADYAGYFDRCRIQLPAGKAAGASTPARRDAFSAGAYDPAYAALYFNYGRYLLISSSRPGTQPANLQGLWAEELQTPWNGDYHLDINVQMNYWPAEVAGLADCHSPLFDLIGSLQEPGAKTAKAYYDAGGWVAHVITNPWGFTAPGESASWGATSSGSPWLCQHLIDHYSFNPKGADARRLYGMLKGNCLFYLDFLIKDPKSGWRVTAPSNSPEIGYIRPDGTRANTCMGPTVDMQSIRCLFEGTLGIARDLGVDSDFQKRLKEVLPRLAPTQIAADGSIQEWLEDWKPQDPRHRHISHLWGLYPGYEIDPVRSPKLAVAAGKTLDVRGHAGTGWSLAHKMVMGARLGEGDRVLTLLRMLAKPVVQKGIVMGGGGSYDNLFCAHPPFQIDGNFGGAAGVAEMLLQSYRDPKTGRVDIRLLPALPESWTEGSFENLRARGDVRVSAAWKAGKLTRVKLQSAGGARGTVRWAGQERMLLLAPGTEAVVTESELSAKP